MNFYNHHMERHAAFHKAALDAMERKIPYLAAHYQDEAAYAYRRAVFYRESGRDAY